MNFYKKNAEKHLSDTVEGGIVIKLSFSLLTSSKKEIKKVVDIDNEICYDIKVAKTTQQQKTHNEH